MFEEVFKVCDQYIPDIDKHSVFFFLFLVWLRLLLRDRI